MTLKPYPITYFSAASHGDPQAFRERMRERAKAAQGQWAKPLPNVIRDMWRPAGGDGSTYAVVRSSPPGFEQRIGRDWGLP